MKQAQYQPLNVALMASSLYAAENGFLDEVKDDEVKLFIQELHTQLKGKHAQWTTALLNKPKLDEKVKQKFEAILKSMCEHKNW